MIVDDVKPSFIVDISPHIETKLAAVGAYASQFSTQGGTSWIAEEIRKENAYLGALIARKFGEAFVCREEIGVVRWDGLV